MRNGLSQDLIARVLRASPKYTLDELEKMYPARDLPDSAIVSRFAPSPTGFMHIGGLYQMLINYKLAKQSDGVFMLRIEDTDSKREISGAVNLILNTAAVFNLSPGEGPRFDLSNSGAISDIGNYGPYVQSARADIYHSVAAFLMEKGLAYPCFLTADEMTEKREEQKVNSLPTGIYGGYARDRDLSEPEIIAKLDAGLAPSVRLYSAGDPSRKIFCRDAARGSIAFPENNEDIVLIKSDGGLPTYHFAHLVDDHFMRTTNVIRGEEWLPSLPLHLQLFNLMGWTPPTYVHTSTLDKIDNESGKQRKLSKRRDPESSVANFLKDGWPVVPVLEYLLNIASAGYEEEKIKNKDTNVWNYPVKIKKIPMSGALFDMRKLEWWSREYIGTLSAEEISSMFIYWLEETYFLKLDESNKQYIKDFLSIERGDPKRIRKDFYSWQQTMEETLYFWDEKSGPGGHGFVPNTHFVYNKSALDAFVRGFDINDDKEVWWNKIKQISLDLNIPAGDLAKNIRVAITGRENAPDLHSVMQVMGDARVRARIADASLGTKPRDVFENLEEIRKSLLGWTGIAANDEDKDNKIIINLKNI